MRAGASVDGSAFDGARLWATQMTGKDTYVGRIGYNYPGGSSARPEGMQDRFPADQTHAMSAAGHIIFHSTKSSQKDGAMPAAFVDTVLPSERFPDMYYWQAGAESLARRHGRVPAFWLDPLLKCVTNFQSKAGGVQAVGTWCGDGGRIYSTAMCVLALSARWSASVPDADPIRFRKTGTRLVRVPGHARVVPTGIYVDNGTALSFRAIGAVIGAKKTMSVGPGGTKKRIPGVSAVTKGGVLRLLAQVGNQKPFPVTLDKDTSFFKPGHLHFLVNDTKRSDNTGWFDVTVTSVR